MSVMAIAVRTATEDDIEAIAAAHTAAWRVGYRGLFPDDYLDSDAFAAERLSIWASRQWSSQPDQTVFAGLVDGLVMGFALVGPDREEPTQGELYAFYVHPDAWGSGVARSLIEAGEQWLRDQGFTNAILWALRDNPRARRFYEKSGWCWTGVETTWGGPADPAGAKLNPIADVKYARPL
jgi:GNAT superfamily N-acetyltransferase